MTSNPVAAPPVEQLIQEGANASARGEKQRALELLHQARAVAPDNPVIFNELGVIHYQLKELDKARDCFLRASRLKPDFARALTNLGACYNEAKNNERAIECYHKALKINPNMVDSWGNLAKAWSESEEFEMSVFCYRKALALHPRPEFKRGLAKAYRKAGRYDRSEQLLREVIAECPGDADAHFGLALTLFHEL